MEPGQRAYEAVSAGKFADVHPAIRAQWATIEAAIVPPLPADVAGLVERLEGRASWDKDEIKLDAASTIRALAREKAAAVGLAQGSGAIADQQRARAEAAEAKVAEQAAEIERLTQERAEAVERYVPAAQYINDLTANVATLTRHIGEQSARADAAEAKLREAVEVIYTAPITPLCDWQCGDGTSHGPCLSDCGVRAWDDRRAAFLSTMEKPND
jgi:hypothetical protein